MNLNHSRIGSQKGKRLGSLPVSHLKCSTQHTTHIDSKGSQVPICLLQKYFSRRQSGREALLVKLSNELIRLVVKPIAVNSLSINSQLT